MTRSTSTPRTQPSISPPCPACFPWLMSAIRLPDSVFPLRSTFARGGFRCEEAHCVMMDGPFLVTAMWSLTMASVNPPPTTRDENHDAKCQPFSRCRTDSGRRQRFAEYVAAALPPLITKRRSSSAVAAIVPPRHFHRPLKINTCQARCHFNITPTPDVSSISSIPCPAFLPQIYAHVYAAKNPQLTLDLDMMSRLCWRQHFMLAFEHHAAVRSMLINHFVQCLSFLRERGRLVSGLDKAML